MLAFKQTEAVVRDTVGLCSALLLGNFHCCREPSRVQSRLRVGMILHDQEFVRILFSMRISASL